ncbi:MAG: hypothetical protein H6719_16070 [Sandaracinaceae bacterium]|nr:hypothetical protein [Sandaracinaceae bacterium]
MRWLVSSWLLPLALAGCTCAEAGPDRHEVAARGSLERAQMTDIVLERVDEQTFDFTARREGQTCHGTVIARPGAGTSTAAMQYDCE